MGSYATEHEHSLCHAAAIGASAVTELAGVDLESCARPSPSISPSFAVADLRREVSETENPGFPKQAVLETGRAGTDDRETRDGGSLRPTQQGFHQGAKSGSNDQDQEEYPP